METGRVPRLTKELCAAMVAGLAFCRPLLVEHRRNARRLGADAPMLTQLWENARSSRYTSGQQAALAAAVALTREPRALPAAVRAELAKHYDDAQTAEILCAIGLANYRVRVANGLMTPEPAQGRVPS
jgi:AhpD family alkylhydroperoxidase